MSEHRRAQVLPLALLLAFGAAAVRAETPDPARLQVEIAASRLDPSRAVSLKNLKLKAGLATLSLDDGILIPAASVGGKTVEMVFLGKGRIEIDPPNAVEAGQLELFTDSARLDEEFTEMVLVLGLDAAADAMLRKPKVTDLNDALGRRAEEIYSKWKGSTERKQLNVDAAVLRDTVGDASYQGFFAAWFHGSELGDFLYLVEPDAQEQVTLGHFVPLEATEKEKRKILRQLNREQRRGRLIGVDLEDLGQWDTWLSASLRGKEGAASPGFASFEPQKYTLDVTLEGRDLRLTGRARLDLKPAVRGSRAVALRLNGDLQVGKVTDGAGAGLFFTRSGRDLTVILPRAPAGDEAVSLTVEYSGSMVEKDGGSFALLDTQEWYPHAGTLDRAPYDVTFHWPRRLELLSCGRRVDGGESGDLRWERRSLEIPVANFAFEVGRYRIETARAGHVEVKLAFNPEVNRMGKEARDEILKTVTDSLTYFEDLFGPYPLDEMTVVTVPRGFSQAMLGFVTLSSVMMLDLDFWNLLFGLEDRRTVIAHEIAHQWWGHQVGWTSYRDQWISEAMANYAALLYARKKLDWKGRYGLGPTSGWLDTLTDTTADGRVIESLGPVVLGQRLFSSRSGDAYQAIVYHKGAVILDMLSRTLGEENFPKVLKQIVKVAANRTISTEDFLSLIERITSTKLDWFADQFVYGTGLPEVYYGYRFEPKGNGKWVARGEARQQAPYRFRYRVIKAAGGGFDVAREKLDQIQVKDSSMLVVPVEIAVYDPSRDSGTRKERKEQTEGNASVRGNILLRGEKTDFAIDIDYEPKGFWLDRHQEVFGRFFNESRNPKRVLFRQGFDAAAAGKTAEAEALFAKALAAEVESTPEASDKRQLKQEARLLDARIDLSRARLYLDQGRNADAQAAFDRAHRVLGSYSGWIAEELKILESRLEMSRGAYDKAFKRLRKGLLRRGDLDSTEGYVLLAIAAKATSHKEEFDEAVKEARENGADVSALAGSGS
jgi:tetratricopeptide (TPR) repeat protein